MGKINSIYKTVNLFFINIPVLVFIFAIDLPPPPSCFHH